MKITSRDNWRVVATISPTRTGMFLATLGFKDSFGQPLQGQVHGADFEITVEPGGPDWHTVGDYTFFRVNKGEEGCKEIRDGMLRHPNVTAARIECDETHACSHCDAVWEELTADEAADEACKQDAHTIAGEPVCCFEGINEFRAERGLPLLTA